MSRRRSVAMWIATLGILAVLGGAAAPALAGRAMFRANVRVSRVTYRARFDELCPLCGPITQAAFSMATGDTIRFMPVMPNPRVPQPDTINYRGTDVEVACTNGSVVVWPFGPYFRRDLRISLSASPDSTLYRWKSTALFDSLFNFMARQVPKPKAFILAGDTYEMTSNLADDDLGEPNLAQHADLRARSARTGIPIYSAAGNHDGDEYGDNGEPFIRRARRSGVPRRQWLSAGLSSFAGTIPILVMHRSMFAVLVRDRDEDPVCGRVLLRPGAFHPGPDAVVRRPA